MEKQLTAMQDEFICGFLSACQITVFEMGEQTLAEQLMVASGYTKGDFLAAQRKSGYREQEMIKVIRNAFRRAAIT